MFNEEEDKVLIIIGAHQDSPKKLSHCIDVISFLKREGFDVCFSTHSSYGIDRISEICDYTVFDYNNDFMDEYDLLNNVENLSDETTSHRFLSWFSHNPDMILRSFFASAPHQKAAFGILKNGTQLSKSKGYKWTIYWEYDWPVPLVSFRSIVEQKISQLKEQKKKAFVLMRGNEKRPMTGAVHLISAGVILYETSMLADNPIFNSPCERHQDLWVSSFSNMLFEEAIEYLLLQSGEDAILYEDWLEFFDLCWGGTEKVNLFNVIRDRKDTKKGSRAVVSEYLKNSFFPYMEGGEYGVYVYCYNMSDNVSFEISDMRIRTAADEIEVEDFSVDPGSWRNTYTTHIGEISDRDDHLFLEFEVKTSLDDYIHHFYQKVAVKDLDKFWRIRRYEKI